MNWAAEVRIVYNGNVTSAADEQIPKPFGRTRRWSLLGTIAAVGMGLIYCLWAGHAQRTLDAKIAEIRARGEPVLAEDFDSKGDLPDEENAAVLLQQAMALNNASVGLVRQARQCPKIDWGLKHRPPMVTTVMPQLTALRSLVMHLQQHALAEHGKGNDSEALKTTDDIIYLGEVIGDYSHSLIGWLVGTGAQGVSLTAIEQIAPELRVEDGTQPTPPTRAEVRALIERLLDEITERRQAREAFFLERAFVVDAAINNRQNPYVADRSGLFVPMFRLDAARTCGYFEQVITAMDQPNASRATAVLPQHPRQEGPSLRFASRFMTVLMAPSVGRVVITRFRDLARRRLAATALAIRLYRLEHDGKWPQSLEELVPKYLPEVPADPFSPDGKKLGYVQGGARPRIYSVADDGKDEGGTQSPTDPWGKDFVVDLQITPTGGWAPKRTTAPATTVPTTESGDAVNDEQ